MMVFATMRFLSDQSAASRRVDTHKKEHAEARNPTCTHCYTDARSLALSAAKKNEPDRIKVNLKFMTHCRNSYSRKDINKIVHTAFAQNSRDAIVAISKHVNCNYLILAMKYKTPGLLAYLLSRLEYTPSTQRHLSEALSHAAAHGHVKELEQLQETLEGYRPYTTETAMRGAYDQALLKAAKAGQKLAIHRLLPSSSNVSQAQAVAWRHLKFESVRILGGFPHTRNDYAAWLRKSTPENIPDDVLREIALFMLDCDQTPSVSVCAHDATLDRFGVDVSTCG